MCNDYLNCEDFKKAKNAGAGYCLKCSRAIPNKNTKEASDDTIFKHGSEDLNFGENDSSE